MWKKVLLTIVAILIAGGALMIYGTYKAADDFVKANESQLRQYAQMDESEQNEYVLEHADEILTQASATAKPDDRADLEFMEKVKDDPAVQKALADLGRAIMAAAIIHSEPIVQDMNDKLKEKFQQEKEHLTERLEKYAEVLESAQAKLKSAQ